MAKFAYNNAKNSSIGHTTSELNYGYQLSISYKKNVNSLFKSKSADELASELQEVITICE